MRRALVRRTATSPRTPLLIGAAVSVAVALGLPLNFYALLHFGGLGDRVIERMDELMRIFGSILVKLQ